MARIEWVRHKLENWARWCSQPASGGLGFPRQSTFARFIGADRRDEANVPLLSLEAEQTDRAVRSLQLSRSHLYLVLKYHYAEGLPIHRVAQRMGRAQSTIKANLEQSDRAIAGWYEEQERARLKLKELACNEKRSFPS
jgi:hypothetical protein